MPRIITVTPNPTFDFAVDADFVEPNRKLRCKNPSSHPGGGGINVARAAHRLGADVLSILTKGGLYGEALVKVFADETVPMRTISIAGDTRIAFHVQDLRSESEYRFNLPGADLLEDEAAAILSAINDETAAGDFVVGSGSLPPGAPIDFWAQCARAAKANDGKFVLDSIAGVREALDEGIYLLRQNRYEYPALAGGDLAWPDEITAFAQKLVANGGAEKVSITHGGDGSIMASNDGKTSRAPAHQIKAASAVGAGDSFVGALLVAMHRGDDDETALNFGMSAAGATRMSPGTALFKPDDVWRLFEKLKNVS